MDTRMPAEVFPAGEYLADELAAREWSQADFADIVGRPVQWVSEIVNGKKEITPEAATQIAVALGTSPETWLRLQSAHQLWRLSRDEDQVAKAASVGTRARLASVVPISILEKRGVVGRDENWADLLADVMDVFQMTELNDRPQLRHAAKRANGGEGLNLSQRGWLWAAQRAARGTSVSQFDPNALDRLVADLVREVGRPEDMASLPERFGDVGVHLVFVEHLPGGKIDGAAFMLKGRPVVAISGRGKRFDKLFFALMHEVGHVRCGHLDESLALDDASEDSFRDDPAEVEANAFAEKAIFGGPVQIAGGISGKSVAAKADELGVPVSFVVGNLQHHQELDWRTTLAKGLPNADHVLQAWGL
jgi:HTH-type transcriptional regulator/antitoxin HigA